LNVFVTFITYVVVAVVDDANADDDDDDDDDPVSLGVLARSLTTRMVSDRARSWARFYTFGLSLSLNISVLLPTLSARCSASE